jgi:hypothetical protein
VFQAGAAVCNDQTRSVTANLMKRTYYPLEVTRENLAGHQIILNCYGAFIIHPTAHQLTGISTTF